MKILVTGGSGFIGSNLVDSLVQQGHEVVVIDKKEPTFRNYNAKYYIINLISDEIENVFQDGIIDVVIHLAAQTSVAKSILEPNQDSNDNIFATLNLLKYCKKYGINKIIASSSAAVYGEPNYLPVDEEHNIAPMSPYALSKYTMEEYIKLSGLDYIIYRFSNVYGPRQQNSYESGVISIFVNNIILHKSITVFGDGEQTRDFIFVHDIVDNIIKSLDFTFKNEIINLSTETQISINNLIKILSKLSKFNPIIKYLDARTGDIEHSVLANSKMLKFGLTASTPLEEGLTKTIKFYNEIQNDNPEILIVIPARGGSVGIPRKNLRNLNGLPLIAYSIRNALKSKYKPDVYVSSDDEEILYISQKIGAQIYKRDVKIADGQTTLDPVIYDAYKNISAENQKKYKLIITLQPTSPLLKTESLDNAIKQIMQDEKIETIISAKDTTHLSWKKENDKYIPNYKERVNRQFLPPIYTETGGFLITRDSVISENSRIGKNVSLFILKNPEEMIDIDTYEDFYLANYYLQHKKILFVVSGYDEIGFGHIYRTQLLANNIVNHEVQFLVTKDSQQGYEKLKQTKFKVFMQNNQNIIDDIKEIRPDVVINDILNTDTEYMLALKDLNIKIINFEDLGPGSSYADAVINALYSSSSSSENMYFGCKYFCARDEFVLSKSKNILPSINEILITFGGTDPNNYTQKVLDSIYNYCNENNIKINVILGLGYTQATTLDKFEKAIIHKDVKNISYFMEKADLIFTSCGRTVYEIACIGTPAIVMAQNERELMHKFACKENGFLNLGLGINISKEQILDSFITLVKNFESRMKMNKAMLSNDLKNGTKRVINLIIDKIKEDF